MIGAHVPARFEGQRHMWFARMCIVASRRAEAASARGATAWANLWHRAAASAREAYRETRPES